MMRDVEALCSVTGTRRAAFKYQNRVSTTIISFLEYMKVFVALHAIIIYRQMEKQLHSSLFSTPDRGGWLVSRPHAII